MKTMQEADGQEVKGLVSVIIPTHNRDESLQQSLLSVLNQSYKQYEIIVIANGCQGKGKTRDIVQTLGKAFKRNIIYLEFDQKLGGAKARNIGIDHANGEYIAFLDDDDRWHSHKLQMQVKQLETGKYAIVSTHSFLIYGDNKRYGRVKSTTVKTVVTYHDMQYENSLNSFSLCMSKKSYIGDSRINEDLVALQDWDLWLKILNNTQLPAFFNNIACTDRAMLGDRISKNIKQVLAGQKKFLALWRHSMDKTAIDHHQMRILCLTLKVMSKKTKFWHYFCSLAVIIPVIYRSRYKQIKVSFLSYLLLPWGDTGRINYGEIKQIMGQKKTQVCRFFLVLKYQIDNMFKRKSGLNTAFRKVPLIISLTSYPQRFKRVFLTIESLLNQTCKPDKIILWLAQQEVSAQPLPKSLTRLVDRGLEIRMVDENTKSYKKLLYTITEFKQAHIITCDDNVMYSDWFLQGLYESHQQHPDCIVAYQCQQMSKTGTQQLSACNQWLLTTDNQPSYTIFASSCGGIFYPANSLHKRVNDPIFKQLCPSAADVWFKAMGLLNQTKTVMVTTTSTNPPVIHIKQSQKNTASDIDEPCNDTQIKQTFDYFQLYHYF